MFNYSVPELTWLAVLLLVLATLVLHYLPFRVILLLWGLVKFSRRLIRPNTVPNNEVLDLLARIPNDEEMVSQTDDREFQEDPVALIATFTADNVPGADDSLIARPWTAGHDGCAEEG